MDQNKILHDPRNQGVPLGVPKTISKPMVRSAQTEHQSCAKDSTIFKQNESSFHLNLVTYEYHRVHPKRLYAYGAFGTDRAPILHRH
jgi:hypothetical protein